MDITIDAEATPAELDAVRSAVRSVGIDEDVRATLERKSVGDLPWVVILAGAWAPFLRRLQENAADDAYRVLKILVRRVRAARGDRAEGSVTFTDVDSGTWILIDPDLPDEAFDQLRLIDPGKDGGFLGHIRYDRQAGRWRNADEA